MIQIVLKNTWKNMFKTQQYMYFILKKVYNIRKGGLS